MYLAQLWSKKQLQSGSHLYLFCVTVYSKNNWAYQEYHTLVATL